MRWFSLASLFFICRDSWHWMDRGLSGQSHLDLGVSWIALWRIQSQPATNVERCAAAH
jgi:hypothetical protein